MSGQYEVQTTAKQPELFLHREKQLALQVELHVINTQRCAYRTEMVSSAYVIATEMIHVRQEIRIIKVDGN